MNPETFASTTRRTFGYDVEVHTIVPGTLSQPKPAEISVGNAIDVSDSIGPHQDIRIYAGQVDPADGSHFTIRYESGGSTHTVHGYLFPDGRVEFKDQP